MFLQAVPSENHTMKHLLAVGLFVAGAVWIGPAGAQVKFASLPSEEPSSRPREITYEQVKGKADLRHGTLVSLELMDKTKVTGHVVRFDAKNDRLYIRTKPGEA